MALFIKDKYENGNYAGWGRSIFVKEMETGGSIYYRP